MIIIFSIIYNIGCNILWFIRDFNIKDGKRVGYVL